MGSIRLERLTDYIRKEFDLQATCRGCGRVAIIDPRALLEIATRRKWPTYIWEVERRLKCAHCGAKGPICGPR